MSTTQRNDARTLAVSRQQADVLRQQTLIVLEAHSSAFEDITELAPAEQLTLVAIYRDAFAVLDAIGWIPEPDATSRDVPLTSGHIAELDRRRADVALTVLDTLNLRADPSSTTDPATLDTEIDLHRRTAHHLWEILTGWQATSSWAGRS
jgi:hypothetical protein